MCPSMHESMLSLPPSFSRYEKVYASFHQCLIGAYVHLESEYTCTCVYGGGGGLGTYLLQYFMLGTFDQQKHKKCKIPLHGIGSETQLLDKRKMLITIQVISCI